MFVPSALNESRPLGPRRIAPVGTCRPGRWYRACRKWFPQAPPEPTGSGDAGAGDAVGSRLKCDLEQVGEDLIGVRPTLVRDDRDGDPFVGDPANRCPSTEVAAGVSECRVAGDQDRLD